MGWWQVGEAARDAGSVGSVAASKDSPWALPVAVVERWIELAGPGERLVYARGARLPRSEGVNAVDRLRLEGQVILNQRRCGPADFEYLATRTVESRAAPKPRVPTPLLDHHGEDHGDDATSRTFALLARCANFKRPCPSNGEIARLLGLAPGSVSYQLDKLKKARLIAVQTDPMGRRSVTIVATGKRTVVAK